MAELVLVTGSVTKILVRHNQLGNEGTTVLCDALRESKVTQVQELDLSYNGIGPDGAKAVAAMATVVGSLMSLNLASNNLGDGTIYVKATKVQGDSFNQGDKVIYQGREMIITEFANTPSSAGFFIKPVAPDLSGIKAIADALSIDCSVTSLDLSAIELRPEGAAALAAAIAVNGSLMRLDVKYNSLGKEGKAVLQKAIEGRSGFELVCHG